MAVRFRQTPHNTLGDEKMSEFYDNRGHNPWHCEAPHTCALCHRPTHEVSVGGYIACEDCTSDMQCNSLYLDKHYARIEKFINVMIASHETIPATSWEPLSLTCDGERHD